MTDIEYLRKTFGELETMTTATHRKLADLLDRRDDQALLAAKNANIKFVSSLALNRCIQRGLIFPVCRD